MKKYDLYFVIRNIIPALIPTFIMFTWHTDAEAQSSATLYGLISTGVAYASNTGGKSLVELMSGPEQLPRVGIKGSEDLGGGTSAIFDLENGFSSINGTLGQGGRMFGRQAFVGLQSTTFGTVTAGRQYDDMTQELNWSESAVQFASIGTRIGDSDNLFNTNRFNDSIRYKSPEIYGLTVAGEYAFSNSTNFSDNSGFSFGSNYVQGNLKVGAAMAQYNRPASTTNPSAAVDDSLYGYTSPFTKSLTGAAVQRQRIFGAGATYDFGFLCATLGYSNVLFEYTDTTGLRVQNGELTLTRRLSPEWLVGLGYIFTVGNYSAGEQVHYNQVNLGAVYSLSKRTDLFLVGVGQRAGGDASYAQIYSLPASSSKVQIAVTGGIRLRF